ncbi:NAD-dependent protein deacylase [Rubripirellula tenax]|uniref:NAD-dependent protein deacylase n=1 Tax=Rubripirellula tenax TaxID=2528015 RepID=A0A5C6EJ50_9BACT|nr:NAD-dependent deacylase [Rubripirellula tenax]TWU48500.1 NAD-dependent protein deacylase [Rubripirellula tenax]
MNVLVLTGAGISAESGIPTFRGADGLWEGHSITDVATPEGFERDPKLVHRFYNLRRRRLLEPDIQPNDAHVALADFEAEHRRAGRGDFLIVTQNIDDLHVRAGSQNVLPMHGELLKARCMLTDEVFDWTTDLGVDTPYPTDPGNDRIRGCLRPHVVWFGEMPIGLDAIATAASRADVFLAIGTSGLVYPASGIVGQTDTLCRRIEINLDDTPASPAFDETIRGKATQCVPEVLSRLLRE